jgi:hypothetical protein
MCEWVALLATSCTDGTATPAVISGPKGAAHITYNCRGATPNKKLYYYVLSPFSEVEKVVLDGGIAGMAFPLDSGRFAVNRFSLKGARDAMAAVQKSALERQGRSTKGQTL